MSYFLITEHEDKDQKSEAKNTAILNRIEDTTPDLEDGEIYEPNKPKTNKEQNCLAAEKFMASFIFNF